MRLKHKVVLIAGSGWGFGRHCARRFAQEAPRSSSATSIPRALSRVAMQFEGVDFEAPAPADV